MVDANIRAVITATDAGASAVLSAFGNKAATVGERMATAGAGLTKGLTLPILGAIGASAKMAMTFQQDMTYVRTQAGDTTDSISKLSTEVLDLAKKSQFSPDELANGLFHLASLGLRGADAMKALDTAQRLAAVGGASLEETTSAVGAAMVTGIKGTQDMNEAAGTLNATIGAGNMRMNDLVGALGTGVLPVFKNAGLTLQDFGAALATLTDNGMNADNAATRLKMTIALMEAPSSQAQKALAAVGMTANQLGMDMQTKGLIPALQDLQRHLLDTYGTAAAGKQQMAQALTEMFGGGRSSAAIQTLLDQIPRVQSKLQEIDQNAGNFADDYAKQQETASARIKTAWSSIQADAIQLGGDVLPGLSQGFSNITGRVTDLVNWYMRLSPIERTVINDFVGLAAAIGPAIIVTSRLVTIMSTLGVTMSTGLSFGIAGLIAGLGLLAFHLLTTKSNSEQLSQAYKQLKIDTDNVKQAQLDYAHAQLNEQQAALSVKEAQQAYNQAVAAYGPQSLQAKQALLNLRDAQLSVKDAQNQTASSLSSLHKQEDAVAKDNSLINHLNNIDNSTNAIIRDANGAVVSLNGLTSKQISSPGAPKSNAFGRTVNLAPLLGGPSPLLNHHAAGTSYAPGGWSMVGEQGPELLNLPTGSKVLNNTDTQAALGGETNMNINITVKAGAFMGSQQDARKYAQQILNAMQDLATSNGMSFSQLWRHHGVRSI